MTDLLGRLQLQRLGDDRPAGLWITSLPWPRMPASARALADRPTYVRPLGQWPGDAEGSPRRLLMVADGGSQAPHSIALTNAGGLDGQAAGPPTASAELVARSEGTRFIWERHRLHIEHQGRAVAFAMGLRTGEHVHWWEACRLTVLEETPTCRVIEMGGAIPLVHSRSDQSVPPKDCFIRDQSQSQKAHNPFMHKHNWLYGHIRARLHANGVCEVFAHHINSRYVDDGADLAPAVPVVGMWSNGLDDAQASALCGVWDGSRDGFDLGPNSFDVSEVSRFATPEKPGRIDRDSETDMLVWQPYLGCEIYGGTVPAARTGDPYVLRAERQVIPRGMARTLRFSFSLSDRSPRVARYLAPSWWYGLCEEVVPEPLLPVMSDLERPVESARQWLRQGSVVGGFEDGSVFRDGGRKEQSDRCEPGWEGEIPYAQFLNAWRYGDAEDYDLALRSAYHFTDVVIDHAGSAVRMHGFPPVAFSLPMSRAQGSIAAFLETGDDYLLDAAETIVESAHRMHHHAWPRMAVGRDACYVRSAVLLYRYFADEHFRKIARKGALAVAHSQRPNGSFGDQGGGTGIHQWPGYITKPWMGLLATNGVLDYLELFPDDEVLLQTVGRFADWLMSERVVRNGGRTWAYQHDCDGWRDFRGETLPSKKQWHQETLARLLGYCALRFGRPDYLDAWAESHSVAPKIDNDHKTAAALQFLPWIQAKLWQCTLDAQGLLQVHAVHIGPRTPDEAKAITPFGDITLQWRDGECTANSDSVNLTVHDWPQLETAGSG